MHFCKSRALRSTFIVDSYIWDCLNLHRVWRSFVSRWFLKLWIFWKQVSAFLSTVLLFSKRTCGIEKDARESPAVFLLCSWYSKSSADENDSRIHSAHICCTNKNAYFSYFLIIFISKIHIFNKIFIQCYLRTKNGKSLCRRDVTISLFSYNVPYVFFYLCFFIWKCMGL